MLGSQMSEVAYPLLVLVLTHSPVKAGVAGTVSLAARLVCRLPAGDLVDRFDRRRIMLAADAIRGAVLATVAVTAVLGALSFPFLLVAAGIENGFGELYRPASSAAVRRVVPSPAMPAAIARLEARTYAASIGGPPLGGLLFAVGRFLPFAADAASYLYSLAATLAVRTPMSVEQPQNAEPLRRRLSAGLRWLWANRLLRALLLSAAGVSLIFTALALAVIVAARDHGAAPTAIGAMLAIAATGGFLGALIAPRLAATAHPNRVILGIFWATTAAVPLMAVDTSPYSLGTLLGLASFLAPSANTILMSYVIAITPDHLQGRVDAAGYFITAIVTPLAPTAAGLLYSAVASTGTFLALGAVMAAVTITTTASATIRHMPRLDQLLVGTTRPPIERTHVAAPQASESTQNDDDTSKHHQMGTAP